MNNESRILLEPGTGELVEKKSRFIATLTPVKSEEEALEVINRLKKQYWDAKHNCFAYIIGDTNPLMRFSDDGEPQGTAGKPMLDVLANEGLTNIVAVVTRYFGGILLGTGGLVRAYQGAVKEGINNSNIAAKTLGIPVTLGLSYDSIGKIQYIMASKEIPALSTDYGEKVTIETIIKKDDYNAFAAELTDTFSGNIEITPKDEVFFANAAEKVIIL